MCWVCLDQGSAEKPLIHPCSCPSFCHAGCIARWQLQSAGTRCARSGGPPAAPVFWVQPPARGASNARAPPPTSRPPRPPPARPPAHTPPPPPPCLACRRELFCDFCKAALPPWKDVLTPCAGTHMPAVMNVNFDNKTYSFEVRAAAPHARPAARHLEHAAPSPPSGGLPGRAGPLCRAAPPIWRSRRPPPIHPPGCCTQTTRLTPPPRAPPAPLQVSPGAEGYQLFTRAIRKAFRLPDDSELNITFTCDEPSSGGELQPEAPGEKGVPWEGRGGGAGSGRQVRAGAGVQLAQLQLPRGMPCGCRPRRSTPAAHCAAARVVAPASGALPPPPLPKPRHTA